MNVNVTLPTSTNGSVASLSELCGRTTKAEFLATHKAPFLLQLTDTLGDTQGCPAEGFGTIALPPGKVAAPSDHRLFELKKRSSNPFADMITVGRAANNDVVIASPCVSKFHAFFRATPRGWAIVDADSSNGTHVDGVPLRSASVSLLDLARAPIATRFGSVVCELFSPEALWDYVQAFFGARAVA